MIVLLSRLGELEGDKRRLSGFVPIMMFYKVRFLWY